MRISDWSSDVCSSDLPFFDAGARPMIVSEGETAVPFYARDRSLAVLTVGWPHSEQGALADFVHLDIEGEVPVAKYALVRREEPARGLLRSEEHTSELQSLMRHSYAVFCLKKKKTNT